MAAMLSRPQCVNISLLQLVFGGLWNVLPIFDMISHLHFRNPMIAPLWVKHLEYTVPSFLPCYLQCSIILCKKCWVLRHWNDHPFHTSWYGANRSSNCWVTVSARIWVSNRISEGIDRSMTIQQTHEFACLTRMSNLDMPNRPMTMPLYI